MKHFNQRPSLFGFIPCYLYGIFQSPAFGLSCHYAGRVNQSGQANSFLMAPAWRISSCTSSQARSAQSGESSRGKPVLFAVGRSITSFSGHLLHSMVGVYSLAAHNAGVPEIATATSGKYSGYEITDHSRLSSSCPIEGKKKQLCH